MTSIQPVSADSTDLQAETKAAVDSDSIATQRKQYVITQALAAIGADQLKTWQAQAIEQFPDPEEIPTITFANGGKLRRVGQVIESCPVGSDDWQPTAWLTVEDMSLFAQLVP